jgi:hypothetical protein
MPIQRSGPVPPYHEYICKHLIIPTTHNLNPQTLALIGPGQQLPWVEIPHFQRGISWGLEQIKEFLNSTSILLGNVILAQFSVSPAQFPFLPAGQPNYMVLVDGLQRFAVGTAILSSLHPEVLSGTPNRPNDAIHFAALQAHVSAFAGYYLHNDAELSQHPRQAVRDQYLEMRRELQKHFEEEFNAGNGYQIAQIVVPTFLSRQVAIDLYFNFNRRELLNTFIGINTVRVDLGPTDLLRALIIEKATTSSWTPNQIEIMENAFTDIFTKDQRPKAYLIPFVNAVIKGLDTGFGTNVFQNWATNLTQLEVDNFLNFISQFEQSILNNGFIREIHQCGKLPFGMILAHYYRQFVSTGNQPSFFTGNTLEDNELHQFLIATYRLLLDGSVGRTTQYLEGIINNPVSPISALANQLSANIIGIPITTQLDPLWLSSKINFANKETSKRVFNAMLLPLSPNFGNPFTPLIFDRKATSFQVDHLIPESLLSSNLPGGVEGQTLRNFAPLPTNLNRVASATSCSSKLNGTGIYSNYLTGTTHQLHPYCQWLVATHPLGLNSADLDNQAFLENNQNPDIGAQRISYIHSMLLARI